MLFASPKKVICGMKNVGVPVEILQTLDIPARQLVCCTGDLADLKYRSCDIEAWSPRQESFEVCSALT